MTLQKQKLLLFPFNLLHCSEIFKYDLVIDFVIPSWFLLHEAGNRNK